MITHSMMMEYTKHMHCKQIIIDGLLYLERYFIGRSSFSDLWAHRILMADPGKDIHSHPWDGKSVVAVGSYFEVYQDLGGKMCGNLREEKHSCESPEELVAKIMSGKLNPEIIQRIHPGHFHRIDHAEKNTWTIMEVEHWRTPFWWFRDSEGGLRGVEASSVEWWKDCRPRPPEK